MASVSYDHVSKRIGRGPAVLEDLSLRVRDGEFMVLVGPSGCGKTTALRLVAGLERATAGVIRIGERVVNDLPPAARDVAMVFETRALFPHLDVFGNLAFGLEARHAARADIDRKVRRTGGTLGLAQLFRRRPEELSVGHQQQVALGRALVRQPRVFLLDQPLAALDAHVREQGRRELKRLQAESGATFLYVTHDQAEAMALGDRVAVLREGFLQQVASPQALYEYPANRYVAGFIGDPPMNLLPVRLGGRVARVALDIPGPEIPLGWDPPSGDAWLGVRPEHLRPASAGDPAAIVLRVDLVQSLGAVQLVHGRLGTLALVARLGRELRISAGDRLPLLPDPDRIHLFEARSGRRMP